MQVNRGVTLRRVPGVAPVRIRQEPYAGYGLVGARVPRSRGGYRRYVGLLEPLLALPDVAPALAAAQSAADTALAQRELRRAGSPVAASVAAELSLRSAVASAALEGHAFELAEVRAGTVTDPVVQGALRVASALIALAPTWQFAPRQVLARLHVLAARAAGAADDTLGRPTATPGVMARLDGVCEMVAAPARAPVLLRAFIVHGELLALRPFAGPSGLVARAAARLTLIAGGFDARGLIATELGHVARQPEYAGAANAYSTGTPDGLRSWLRHCSAAVELAASELVELTRR